MQAQKGQLMNQFQEICENTIQDSIYYGHKNIKSAKSCNQLLEKISQLNVKSQEYVANLLNIDQYSQCSKVKDAEESNIDQLAH